MTPLRLTRPVLLLLAALLVTGAAVVPARAQSRVGDMTHRPGEVPRRLVGYGLVVGLDGTGDRSLGGYSSATPTVRSVVNLLRRFSIEVPPERLRLRDVAAVLVTSEVSPWVRSGGRFEVQVSAIGDATSLRGGVLWMTPLVADPNQPPVGTAQGALLTATDDSRAGTWARRANSGRIPQGGVLELDGPTPALRARLLLREPDLSQASRIAQAVNAVFGAGTAKVEDPGAVSLTPPQAQAADLPQFMAAVDTVRVTVDGPARVVIEGREGTVVAGGTIRVGAAVVSHHGLTLQVGGGAAARGQDPAGLVRLAPEATVQDIAAGLQAAGARPDEVGAIFEALRAAGALHAEVRVR
jgi:flagellar P-ring protein FlgI